MRSSTSQRLISSCVLVALILGASPGIAANADTPDTLSETVTETQASEESTASELDLTTPINSEPVTDNEPDNPIGVTEPSELTTISAAPVTTTITQPAMTEGADPSSTTTDDSSVPDRPTPEAATAPETTPTRPQAAASLTEIAAATEVTTDATVNPVPKIVFAPPGAVPYYKSPRYLPDGSPAEAFTAYMSQQDPEGLYREVPLDAEFTPFGALTTTSVGEFRNGFSVDDPDATDVPTFTNTGSTDLLLIGRGGGYNPDFFTYTVVHPGQTVVLTYSMTTSGLGFPDVSYTAMHPWSGSGPVNTDSILVATVNGSVLVDKNTPVYVDPEPPTTTEPTTTAPTTTRSPVPNAPKPPKSTPGLSNLDVVIARLSAGVALGGFAGDVEKLIERLKEIKTKVGPAGNAFQAVQITLGGYDIVRGLQQNDRGQVTTGTISALFAVVGAALPVLSIAATIATAYGSWWLPLGNERQIQFMDFIAKCAFGKETRKLDPSQAAKISQRYEGWWGPAALISDGLQFATNRCP